MINLKMKNFYSFLKEFLLPTLDEVKAFDLEEERRKRDERERKKAIERMEKYVEKHDEEKYAAVMITPTERFRWFSYGKPDYICVHHIVEDENGILFGLDIPDDNDAFHYFSMLTGSSSKLLFAKFYVLFMMMDMTAWKLLGYLDELMIPDRDAKHVYAYKFAYQWMPVVWDYFTSRDVMAYMVVEEK